MKSKTKSAVYYLYTLIFLMSIYFSFSCKKEGEISDAPLVQDTEYLLYKDLEEFKKQLMENVDSKESYRRLFFKPYFFNEIDYKGEWIADSSYH